MATSDITSFNVQKVFNVFGLYDGQFLTFLKNFFIFSAVGKHVLTFHYFRFPLVYNNCAEYNEF